MQYTTIPSFILTALQQCAAAGVVPSVREGQGGNSHSVWFIKFAIRVDRDGHMSKYYYFEVKVTSSYSQQFLDFTPFSGGKDFDGLTNRRSMAECLMLAQANVEALSA